MTIIVALLDAFRKDFEPYGLYVGAFVLDVLALAILENALRGV
jgi:hypothetical protein